MPFDNKTAQIILAHLRVTDFCEDVNITYTCMREKKQDFCLNVIGGLKLT